MRVDCDGGALGGTTLRFAPLRYAMLTFCALT